MGTRETAQFTRNLSAGWWLALILAVSIGVSILAGARMVNSVGQSERAARAELAPIVERYLQLTAAGDAAILADWIDPGAEPAWQEALISDPTAALPKFDRYRLGKLGPMNEGVDDIYQVDLLGTIRRDAVDVPAFATLYFRRSDGAWRPTFPPVREHWGPVKSFDSGPIALAYRIEESQGVLDALSDASALVENLRSVDPAATLPALTVAVDPVRPLAGPKIDRTDGRATVRMRSASTGWGAIAPRAHLRAQYAGAVLDLLGSTDDVHRRAARWAVARYWMGYLNEAHPRFDTRLIAVARPMVTTGRWPALTDVLTGNVTASEAEREAALNTAYLWLLSEGLTVSELQDLVAQRANPADVEAVLRTRLEQTPVELEAAWRAAARVRYGDEQ